MRGVLHQPHQLRPYTSFLDAAANGTLPNYSWITPRAGIDVVRVAGGVCAAQRRARR